ncbi:MAG: response regulator transcription factor, partial [Acidobacteria bacterium]|nr:response regulator transcription factor [Acidobacteriota bacterium]
EVLEALRTGEAGEAVRLTTRQTEVLQLVAEGRSAKEIGAILNLSPRTVESHKYAIMDAIGVKTTAELVQYAVKNGLVRP